METFWMVCCLIGWVMLFVVLFLWHRTICRWGETIDALGEAVKLIHEMDNDGTP